MLQFLAEPRRILVVEDKVSFALQLTAFLERAGHQVHCYEGVSLCDGKTLTGLRPLTITSPPEIDISQIECAFLDHYFAGSTFDGTSLCRLLAPVGVRVIGMSSVDPANHSMMRVGATIAIRKDLIMNWLRAK